MNPQATQKGPAKAGFQPQDLVQVLKSGKRSFDAPLGNELQSG